MAFTRKFLSALGIESDKIDQIIDAHAEVTEALKAERDQYKSEAEKLPDVQKQLDDAQKKIAAAEKEDYKGKYESEKAAHDKLKTDVASKETLAKKESALKAALKDAGYSESGIAKIARYGGFTDAIELDSDGKIKDIDKLKSSIESEWGEYKGAVKKENAEPAKPPANTAGATKRTKEEIMEIQNTAERQKAIAENPEAFGYPKS